jgi:hypothetical protein
MTTSYTRSESKIVGHASESKNTRLIIARYRVRERREGDYRCTQYPRQQGGPPAKAQR